MDRRRNSVPSSPNPCFGFGKDVWMGGAHAQVPRQTPKRIIAPIGSWSGSQTNWQRVADLNYITVMCLTASPFPFKGMFSFQTAQTGEPLFNTLSPSGLNPSLQRSERGRTNL